jgi:hypothetical protein
VLTNARVQAQIAESQGEAELARARKQAEQTVVTAEATLAHSRREAEQTVVLAKADSERLVLLGRGEGQRVMQTGLAEASVLLKKISSFGDPRLYALSRVSEALSHSTQPLVPERLFIAGGGKDDQQSSTVGTGMLGLLINLLVAEKTGFQPSSSAELAELQKQCDELGRSAEESLQSRSEAGPASATSS